MKRSSLLVVSLALLATAPALAQTWIDEYQKGLDAAQSGDWMMARDRFKKAAGFRGKDSNVASELPGGSGRNRTIWRGGAPYSPNFASAYSAYRIGLETADTGERTKTLLMAARELEVLLKEKQHSIEAYYTLGQIYNLLRDPDMVEDVEKRQQEIGRTDWRVDNEFMSPSELTAVASLRNQLVAVKVEDPKKEDPPVEDPNKKPPVEDPNKKPPVEDPNKKPPVEDPNKKPPVEDPNQKPPTEDPNKSGGNTQRIPNGSGVTVIKAKDLPAYSAAGGVVSPDNITGRIPTLSNKYALVIGNTESLLPDGRMTFASTDATMVADALRQHGGYDDANVEILLNATSEQIRIASQALADRIPENATVTIFFAGVGQNVAGEDYIAGAEASTPYDTTAMINVSALLRSFMAKGARLFTFYQVNRTIKDGRYFGQRPPNVGAVSQMMGTMPGANAGSIVDKGVERGIYALAFARTLEQTRSNQIAIMDFGWSVFNSMKGGTEGVIGGGGTQVPTLPVLSYLPSDARF